MSVIYHNRRKLSEEQSGGAEYVSFDELLTRSDVLSLNLPLNVSTNFSTPSQRLLEAPQSLSQNSPHSRLSPFLSLIVSLSFRSVARSLASLPFSLACRFRLSHQNNPRPGKTRRARDLGERYPRFFPSFHEAFHRPPPPPFFFRLHSFPEPFQNTSITQASSCCTESHFPIIPEMCNLPLLTHITPIPHPTHTRYTATGGDCTVSRIIPQPLFGGGECRPFTKYTQLPYPLPSSKYIPDPGEKDRILTNILFPPNIEKHAPYHLRATIRQDEARRHHRQHGARRGDGRGRAGEGARERAGRIGGLGRVRGGAQGSPGPGGEPARHARAAYGDVDGRGTLISFSLCVRSVNLFWKVGHLW